MPQKLEVHRDYSPSQERVRRREFSVTTLKKGKGRARLLVNGNKDKNCKQCRRDGAVGKVSTYYILQGPEWDPQCPCKKLGDVCSPKPGEVGDPLSSLDSQTCLN